MTTLFDAAQVRQVEARCLAAVPPGALIERAGAVLARRAEAMSLDMPAPVRILALRGPGHNGDDAFAALQTLAQRGFATGLITLQQLQAQDTAARAAFLSQLDAHCLLIDGLFGIGLNRPLDASLCALVEALNQQSCRVLAVDLPSGLDASTGSTWGAALRADCTLTFLLDKTGLHTGQAAACVGTLVLEALDCQALIADALQHPDLQTGRARLLDEHSLARLLPRRSALAHKGSQGSVLVVGGSAGMRGAAILAALGAQASGAGKTHLHLLGADANQHDALAPLRPDLMTCREWPGTSEALRRFDALLVGCGLGQDELAAQALVSLLASCQHLKLPLVLDADALNLLAGDRVRLPPPDPAQPRPWVATPHPLEAARLLGCDVPTVQRDRLASAQALADQLGMSVILKGPGSVIAHPPASQGAPPQRPALAPPGSAALAVGGSGDILAGMILGLLGQGLSAASAAELAACAHALAGSDALTALPRGQGLSPQELPGLVRARLNAMPGPAIHAPPGTRHPD